MIETIYQPPIMCYSIMSDEPFDVTEILDRLIMEEDFEYIPYQANLFNSDEVKQATEWIEEVSSPKTETKREKYLKYQREYYKKNAEKRKAEMMRNYYIKKITM